MLKKRSHPHQLERTGTDVAIRPAAGARLNPGAGVRCHTSLVLPALANIRRSWEYNPSLDRLVSIANQFADAGLLTRAGHSLQQSLGSALETLANNCRPGEGLMPLGIAATDNIEELGVIWDSYASENKIPLRDLFSKSHPAGDPDLLRALLISFDYENLGVHTIGPALEALEAWPRLGQTVLHLLETGLQKTVRTLSPGTGLAWASAQYWGHEEDESQRLEDELTDIRGDVQRRYAEQNPGKPPLTDEQIIENEINIFRRKDYDAWIPPKWHVGCKPLKSLPVKLDRPVTGGSTLSEIFWMEDKWPEIWEACELVRHLSRGEGMRNDNRYCERIIWEAVPVVLRMSHTDPLTHILDDFYQSEWECGENSLEINSVFLFYDVASLKRAASRVRKFLLLVRACENLIHLLQQPARVKVPVRV